MHDARCKKEPWASTRYSQNLSPISSKIKTHVVSHYLLDQPAPLENQDVVCSRSVVGVVSDKNAGFLSKKSLNGLELVDGWGSVEETERKEAQRAFKFQRSVPVVSLSVCLLDTTENQLHQYCKAHGSLQSSSLWSMGEWCCSVGGRASLKIEFPTCGSSADSGSSKRYTSSFPYRARARDTRWR